MALSLNSAADLAQSSSLVHIPASSLLGEMYGPLIVHRLIKLWPRSSTQMSNPQDSEGEPVRCTHMWRSALASGALAFVHEIGEITPVWDKTVKWAGYEVRRASQNSIMPNSHLLARKIRAVWIAVMWRHRCVFFFSSWESVILHNPIQLLCCVYSGTVIIWEDIWHLLNMLEQSLL